MAFVLEEEKKSVEWMPILYGVVGAAFIIGAVYYLFFSSSPLITTLSGSSDLQKQAEELERVTVVSSQEAVVSDPTFKSLRQQVPPLSTTNLGRPNPFSPF